MLTTGQRRKKANKKEQVIPIENKPQKKRETIIEENRNDKFCKNNQ